MGKELITTGKTVDEAVELACRRLETTRDNCTVTILQEPKKSLFGLLRTEAKVKVAVKDSVKVAVKEKLDKKAALVVDEKPANVDEKVRAAVDYLKAILDAMGLEQVHIDVQMQEESAMLVLEGENLGVLIGRRGETLDSLQYLTSLVCNRVEGKYFRVTLNCGNYRKKREEALKELAKKISLKVKRTGRSQMLESMNPYERRIIHSEISAIEGVTSKSKGEEPNRRVIILPAGKGGPRGGYRNKNNRSGGGQYQKRKPERTMEDILKADRSDTEKKAQLYSKIEL